MLFVIAIYPFAGLLLLTLVGLKNRKRTLIIVGVALSILSLCFPISAFCILPAWFRAYPILLIPSFAASVCSNIATWILIWGLHRAYSVEPGEGASFNPLPVKWAFGFAMLFVLMIPFVFIPDFWGFGAARSAEQSRAKSALRSLATAMGEYRASNVNSEYGTFEDLKRAGQFSGEATLDNLTRTYKFTLNVDNAVLYQPSGETGQRLGTYTIIAYPRETAPDFLATFGVCDDGVVRMFNPPSNEFNSVRSWDPIL
jgi:hypothetical protein